MSINVFVEEELEPATASKNNEGRKQVGIDMTKCNPEIFTTALLMPTLKCAQLSTLQHLLTFNDCTLAKWWPYLIHSCRHLQHLGYMNVLYHMQLFMEHECIFNDKLPEIIDTADDD